MSTPPYVSPLRGGTSAAASYRHSGAGLSLGRSYASSGSAPARSTAWSASSLRSLSAAPAPAPRLAAPVVVATSAAIGGAEGTAAEESTSSESSAAAAALPVAAAAAAAAPPPPPPTTTTGKTALERLREARQNTAAAAPEVVPAPAPAPAALQPVAVPPPSARMDPSAAVARDSVVRMNTMRTKMDSDRILGAGRRLTKVTDSGANSAAARTTPSSPSAGRTPDIDKLAGTEQLTVEAVRTVTLQGPSAGSQDDEFDRDLAALLHELGHEAPPTTTGAAADRSAGSSAAFAEQFDVELGELNAQLSQA